MLRCSRFPSGAIAGAANADTSTGASAADASATGLIASAMKAVPNGRKAVLFTGFGSDPLFPKDPTPELAAMLSNAGYDVEKRDATVTAFEIAYSDHVNVVHLRTHGGAGIVFNPLGNVDGKKWAAWTLTPASKENIQLYEADLKRGLLAIMDERVSASRHEEHFGITANFIGTRWSLESGAYVHASSCYLGAHGEYTPASGNPPGHANTDLQAAIFENDAMLFAGWTKATEVTMLDQNARYTFDRLLGANVETPKESPSLNPKVVADTSCEQCFAFFGKTTPEAPKKLWRNIMPSVSEANRPHEKIYQYKNDEWVQIVDRQVPITFPLDRSGIADVSDLDTGTVALMLPATIAEDGTIEAGDTQTMGMSFIGAGNVTGWTFRHQLKWAAMSPATGTEIDASMPR